MCLRSRLKTDAGSNQKASRGVISSMGLLRATGVWDPAARSTNCHQPQVLITDQKTTEIHLSRVAFQTIEPSARSNSRRRHRFSDANLRAKPGVTAVLNPGGGDTTAILARVGEPRRGSGFRLRLPGTG